MSFLLALLMVASGPAATCRNSTEITGDAQRDGSLVKFGTGLWIGGLAFAPVDIDKVQVGFSTYDETPNITVVFSQTGQAKFLAIQKGRIGNELPIYLDRKLIMCPILLEQVLGGQVQLSGGFTANEARTIAQTIKPDNRE